MYSFEGFEWDEAKAETNLVKHGFDFYDAWQALEDPLALTDESLRNGELRYRTIGICKGKLAAVVHTERYGICRIISVRHARDNEKKAYYGNS